MLNDWIELNDFNYFLTIHINNKLDYKKLMNNLKHKDKQLKYISLAVWSLKSNLHYHILVQTGLDIDTIYSKSKHLINNREEGLKPIWDKTMLKHYFIYENLKDDVIKLLEIDTRNNIILKNKQIDILKHGKLISNSRNIIKPIVIKYSGDTINEEIPELQDTIQIGTKEYKALDSSVTINNYIKRRKQ
ncbi:hypothetical protein [uncultured Clostridium sp.]|uniref:hypothetical protein n=1 Tax=uncultured Clostridium sp. TaxID=59620 RepID=UPI0026258102|nr:hypothetical protein [uncultured Clostridium sp.]